MGGVIGRSTLKCISYFFFIDFIFRGGGDGGGGVGSPRDSVSNRPSQVIMEVIMEVRMEVGELGAHGTVLAIGQVR